jgi:hypothetical protein
MERRPAHARAALVFETAWLFGHSSVKRGSLRSDRRSCSRPKTPDPAEIINKACEQMTTRLRYEDSVRAAGTSSCDR